MAGETTTPTSAPSVPNAILSIGTRTKIEEGSGFVDLDVQPVGGQNFRLDCGSNNRLRFHVSDEEMLKKLRGAAEGHYALALVPWTEGRG